MTYATDAGFEVGKLYEVKRTESNTDTLCVGMILRLAYDDRTALPEFEYHSGPSPEHINRKIYVSLEDLKPFQEEEVKLIKAYVKMHYSNDTFLALLVSKL